MQQGARDSTEDNIREERPPPQKKTTPESAQEQPTQVVITGVCGLAAGIVLGQLAEGEEEGDN